jgi:hypothetical protein
VTAAEQGHRATDGTNESSEASGTGKPKRERDWFRIGAGASIIVAAGGGLFLFVWIILHKVESDEAGVAALCGLIAVGLLLAMVTPTQRIENLLAKIKSVKIGSFDIELNDYRQLVEGKKVASANEGVGEVVADPAGGPFHDATMAELRATLESRLAFLAKHHFCDATNPAHPIPEYLNIGSLLYDKYLNEKQAKTAYEILGMRQFELKSLSSEDEKLFVEGANEFINTFRVQVFANQVAKQLRGRGWQVSQAYPKSPRLRDLLVSRPGNPAMVTHQVVPIYVRAKARLSIVKDIEMRLKDDHKTRGGGQQMIVVPPGSQVGDDNSSIPILMLPSLLDKLTTTT